MGDAAGSEAPLARGQGPGAHFPCYATFGENETKVIHLKALPVNMLADLAAWSVQSADAVKAITDAFGTAVVPPPPSTR